MPTQRDVERLQALREAKRRGMLGPIQSEAVGVLERRFSDYLKGVSDRAKSVVEPAMTAVSASIAEPVSGLVGLAALPFGVDVSTRAIERTQDAMTYQPRSEAGRQGLQGLQELMAPVGEAFEGASSYLGDAAYEATGSPAAGAAAYSIPALGLELLGLKGTRAASKAGKLGRQLEVGDIGRGNVGAKQRGIFAGAKAKTADMDALAKAQDMAAKGASRDEIWTDTGWFKDVDGRWKFEIDDSASRATDMSEWGWANREDMKAGSSASGAIGEFLQHDELARNYDGIVDFGDADRRTIMGVSSEQTGRGSFDPVAGIIDVGMEGQGVNRSTALHEIQHNIQEVEGFAEGGSVSAMMRKLAQRKARADSRIAAVNAEMRRVVKEMEGNPPNMAELDARYDALLDERIQYMKDAQLDPEIQAFDEYRRLAGEAEARNVEARMNMTPEQRRASPPWETLDVPESDLNVRRTGGTMESALPPGAPQGRVMNTEPDSKLTFIETPDGRVQMYNPNREKWTDVTESPIAANVRRKDAEIQAAGGVDEYQRSIDDIRKQRDEAVRQYRQEAARQGETYKMQHTAPMLDDNPSGSDLSSVMPDVYRPDAKQFHGTGAPYDDKALNVIRRMQGKPNAEVTVYRAVPEGVDEINPGDWVTTTKEYARDHIGNDEGYKIISKKVKAKELANDGNSIHEFGFDPGKR